MIYQTPLPSVMETERKGAVGSISTEHILMAAPCVLESYAIVNVSLHD